LLKHDKRSKVNATQWRLMKLAGRRCVFALILTSTWLLNGVQVKRSRSVLEYLLIGSKRGMTWHASAFDIQ